MVRIHSTSRRNLPKDHAMESDAHRPRIPLVVLGELWVACGLVLPSVLLLRDPGRADWLLTLVLMLCAAVLSNIEFRFSQREDAPRYCPVGAPIVLAIVACEPAHAALVATVGFLCDLTAIRGALRGERVRQWFETAGLASMTTWLVATVVAALGGTIANPGPALFTVIAAAAGFLAVDAASHTIATQIEFGAGREVLDYFRGVAPLDIGFTATITALAVPFVDKPLVAVAVIAAWQAALVLLYRMSASESVHREQAGYLREVFTRYVPESVAERLASRTDEVKLGGESRLVSVLFCDIRGFTSWAEQHDAETVVRELNAVLGELTEAVMRNEGTLDKFTGDGLMAFWGAPLDQPDHAGRARRAAADIHEALDRCNAQRAEKGMQPFSVGVGIATGMAVVGNVGHERRLDYTAIGDTVNLAARLEATTKEFGVPTVISAATARLLLDQDSPDDWPVDLGSVVVKGKMHPVEVWALHHGREPDRSYDVA